MSIRVVLVGLDKKKMAVAKKNGLIGIPRTENVNELVALYSGAFAFLNLTYEDNYPTTNLEAMACGTPVLTYKTGGSPESVGENTGWVVNPGDVNRVVAIIKSNTNKSEVVTKSCLKRAQECFDKNKCFSDYFELYNSLL